jgi:ribulose-5-phosphate 4-epimerase/fuculose-1-phosphate aldolase
MILRNHGLLVGGRSVADAFNMLYRLERACQVQVMAMSCNTELTLAPAEAMERTYQTFRSRRLHDPAFNGDLAWAGLLRRLDRLDTSYRN